MPESSSSSSASVGPAFKRAFAKVYLAEDQPRRYEVRKGDSGWVFYEDLAQLAKDKLMLFSLIPPGTYLRQGNEAISEAMVIDRTHLKGVMLRPIEAWMDEELVKEQYDFSADGEWEYQTSADGSGTEALQTRSNDDLGAPLTSQVSYMHNFCPNGFFTVSIRCQALEKETVDEMRALDDYTDASYRQIIFGGGAWCLFLPGHGKPILYEHLVTAPRPEGYEGEWPEEWVPREWTDGQLGALDVNSFANDGKVYYIGVIGHAIAVSESNFDDDFAYYMVQNSAQPVVPAGYITARSWPGQAAMSLAPLTFHSARLWRYPYWVEDVAPDRVTRQVWGEVLRYPNIKKGSGVRFAATERPLGYLQWALEIDPGEVPDDDAPLRSYTTPFVQSTTLWQTPVVTDNGEPDWTELPYLYELDGASELGSSTAGSYSLAVDNRMALSAAAQANQKPPTVLLRPGRALKLETGRKYWDDTEDSCQLAEAVVVEVPRTAQTARVEATDLLGMLALSGWRHGSLSLIGFTAKAAIELLLQLEGFGTDWYGIEDVGTALYAGANPENELWSYDEGTPIADILSEIARYGMHDGVVYYDGTLNQIRTGCRYCRIARTSATWDLHSDNGWNSSGCISHDQGRNADGVDLHLVAGSLGVDAEYQASTEIAEDLEVDEAVLRDAEYANAVQVWGQAADGRKLGAWMRNEKALWLSDAPDEDYGETTGREYVGWPVWRREEMRHATTQDEVSQRCAELAAQLFPWPLVIRHVRVPYHHELRPGWVLQIEGSEATDAKGRKFRVTSVQPDLRGQKMTLTARELLGVTREVVD